MMLTKREHLALASQTLTSLFRLGLIFGLLCPSVTKAKLFYFYSTLHVNMDFDNQFSEVSKLTYFRKPTSKPASSKRIIFAWQLPSTMLSLFCILN